MTAGQLFELDPETYDALVDWPKRLANEEPLYRRLFESSGARSVLDVACGTGRHAALFYSWGLAVEGADADAGMLAYCRSRYGESERLRWVQRSYTESAPQAAFDAVICVGNSLALAPDLGTVRRTLAAMLAALRSGGVCIVQVLNLWRFAEGPTTWQKCQRLRQPGSDRILLKGIHRSGEYGLVDFVELRLSNTGVSGDFHGARFLGLRAADLLAAATAAGGSEARVCGTFQEERYDPASSPDLILTCLRAER